MNQQELPDYEIIQCKDGRLKAAHEFYKKILQAGQEGKVLWDDAPPRLTSCLSGIPTVTLLDGDGEVTKVEETEEGSGKLVNVIAIAIEGITKKAEILQLAEVLDIKVDSEAKVNDIKEVIKSSLMLEEAVEKPIEASTSDE